MPIPGSLSRDLRQAMETRALAKGYRLLDKYADDNLSLDDLRANDYLLLYELSRWFTMRPDIKQGKIARILESDAARIKFGSRSGASLDSFVYFSLATAFAALTDLDTKTARRAASRVLGLGASIDRYLRAGAHFCKGRSLELDSKSGDALKHFKKSSKLFEEENQLCLSAVANLQVHRLYLQLPEHSYSEAKQILESAEMQLTETGDLLNKAYIHHLWARTLRTQGQYKDAANRFNDAVKTYKEELNLSRKKKTPPRMMVRSLEGQARALRYRANEKDETGAYAVDESTQQALRDQATRLLEVADKYAEAINAKVHDRCKIRLTQAYLHLDKGRSGRGSAKSKAEEIFAEYQDADDQDPAILARAHILRFKIHMLQIEGATDRKEAARHAELALQYAKRSTRRVQARAWIARGHAEFLNNQTRVGIQSARECAKAAAELLHSEDRDYLRAELTDLQSLLKDDDPDPLIIKIAFSELYSELRSPRRLQNHVKSIVLQAVQHRYDNWEQMKDDLGTDKTYLKRYLKEEGFSQGQKSRKSAFSQNASGENVADRASTTTHKPKK